MLCRKRLFLEIGIEAHAVLRVLAGWEDTIPAEDACGLPALQMTGYITEHDDVIFRDIVPAWVSPPIVGS